MYLFNHYLTVENKYFFSFESVFASSGLWGSQRDMGEKDVCSCCSVSYSQFIKTHSTNKRFSWTR